MKLTKGQSQARHISESKVVVTWEKARNHYWKLRWLHQTDIQEKREETGEKESGEILAINKFVS